MTTTKSHVADWEILHKKPNEPHQFFHAPNCTESQAWLKFEKEPRDNRGRILHIRIVGSHSFKTYDDKEA